MTSDSPPDVDALYEGVTRLLDTVDSAGRKAGDCTCGVYLFIDYDGEPIYVGQTKEKLRTRIRRHLTNQRTDAVAMRVLDPFEVAEIEMWPFWDLDPKNAGDTLDRAEYTVYQHALSASKFDAVLNEGDIAETDLIDLPQSVRGAVLPNEARESREHPDLRLARRARTIADLARRARTIADLARRARTIADLARVISERQVSHGIRRTMWIQARRLEHLARTRLEELSGH